MSGGSGGYCESDGSCGPGGSVGVLPKIENYQV